MCSCLVPGACLVPRSQAGLLGISMGVWWMQAPLASLRAALPPYPVVFLGLGGRRSCGGGDVLLGHRGLALHSP